MSEWTEWTGTNQASGSFGSATHFKPSRACSGREERLAAGGSEDEPLTFSPHPRIRALRFT